MTLEQKIELCAKIVENSLKIYAPKDTGNLSINGIRSVFVDGVWTVVVGGEPAPYAVFTNEPWESGAWRGKRNPNQGWIMEAIDAVKPTLIGIFQGVYTDAEIRSYNAKLKRDAKQLIKDRMRGVINYDIRATV